MSRKCPVLHDLDKHDKYLTSGVRNSHTRPLYSSFTKDNYKQNKSDPAVGSKSICMSTRVYALCTRSVTAAQQYMHIRWVIWHTNLH